MNQFLDTLLSPIAPHMCVACGTTGSIVCDDCIQLLPDLVSRCYRCNKITTDFKTCVTCKNTSPLHAVYICTEYETVAKALVQKLKFERTYAAASTIARAMTQQLGSYIPQDVPVTFVPTATNRVRQRGYDQAQIIAKSLAGQLNVGCTPTLTRLGQQRQTSSSRTQRLAQMHDAFTVRAPSKIPKQLLLVDDVMTTGSTLESVARTLKTAGAEKVSAIVFARAV